MLSRAIQTAKIILKNINEHNDIVLKKNWLLNEWHRGAFIGINKNIEKIDKPTWHSQPLPMTSDHQHFNDIHNDIRYIQLKQKNLIPNGESLEDTKNRFIQFWEAFLLSDLKENKRILIVAHQNIFKGAVKFFDKLTDEEAIKLKILNGKPFYYEFDENLKPKNKLTYIS